MICFNCGIKLHIGGMEECQLCGVKFAQKCPSCEFPNPMAAKYCFNCGCKIAKSEAQSSIQNYDTLTENRKNVAVIFADVSGFTSLSEKLDPEEVRELINDCFNYITKPVYEMEGTIDKYMGDCVMILFGAKYIHGDDAKRAVTCAVKMMNLIKEFSEERLSSKDFSLNLSIGVNYGLVVTGSVGNYFDKDYTVMGDIVNIAQRLQSNAERGSILVSESVYMETRDVVHYSSARELTVKNKENPVRCYMPLGLNSEYSFERDISFVEREKEIYLINTIYNLALNTSTQCITVIGEAGIGKTRLLKEFVSKVGSDIKKVWVDCSPTSQNRVYFLISGILMSVMNISPEDSTNARKHRLMSFLDYILSGHTDEEIKRNYDFLGLLLGMNRDNEFQNLLASMSFENIRREIIKQLSIFFVNLCRKHRFVAIIDDVHWADTNSLQILKALMELLPDVNAIFVFTSRYDVEMPGSEDKDRYHTIRIGALSDTGIRGLTCSLLGCSRIDKTLLDAILRFTKGNPLYIREFVSNIKRAGKYHIEKNTAYTGEEDINLFPNTIQSLILSNVSQLDDTIKSFLQAASVVGKDFTLSLVNGLLEVSIHEDAGLRLPIQLNIISLKTAYTSSGAIEKVYTFNHDVEREVIYESILNKDKKELHRKIAEHIESKFIKDVEDYYEILCTHFHKAGIDKKAAEYYYKTAIKYKNGFNFNNSVEYFNKFLELTGSQKGSAKDSRITDALRDMGYINFVTANYETALDYLDKALSAASSNDDISTIKIMTAEVYKEQGVYEDALRVLDEIQPKIRQSNSMYGKLLQMKCNILRIMGNPEALSLAKRSEKILLKTKDYSNLSETMNQAGLIYFIKGDIDNALYYLNKSYQYAGKINNLEAMAKVSGNLGIIYHATGMISQALEFYNTSMDISSKISDPQGNISGCINLGILYMDKGLFNKAEGLFNESLRISRDVLSRLNECISLTNLGDVMYEKGLFDEALQSYNSSLEIARDMNVPVEEGVNYIGIARLYLKQGAYLKVPEILDKAFKIFTEADEAANLGDYYQNKSLYELLCGNTGEAVEWIEKAINISSECDNDRKKLGALRIKGNILVQKGSYSEAVELLDQSIILAEQVESEYEAAKGYFRKYEALLKAGQLSEAEKSLIKSKEYMQRVDRCRWSSVIEEEKFNAF